MSKKKGPPNLGEFGALSKCLMKGTQVCGPFKGLKKGACKFGIFLAFKEGALPLGEFEGFQRHYEGALNWGTCKPSRPLSIFSFLSKLIV